MPPRRSVASISLMEARRTSSTAIISRSRGAVALSSGGSTCASLNLKATSDDRRVIFLRPETQSRQSVRRSEEHTSELQSLTNLVCRLLLEKKKKKQHKKEK